MLRERDTVYPLVLLTIPVQYLRQYRVIALEL